MKNIQIIIMTLFITTLCFAQNGINYKALIKDDLGNILANQAIDMEFSILQEATTVYKETHAPTTDNNGIIIVNIGEGTVVSGIFDNINWGDDAHFLNVQINTGSGLVDLGTTQFMAVPYALSAANVKGLEAIDEGAGIAWRLVGRNPDNYGNIGGGAIDLSSSTDNTQDYGATGTSAFATGFKTIASGGNSTAMGNNTMASGIRSTAMGLRSNASGGNSIAMGEDTTASGLVSTAMGNNTTASGENSTALGQSTEAIGENSVAMGGFTEASGDFSFAFGNGSEAQGNNSIAMGDDAFATSNYAVALGRDAFASGQSSFAAGYNAVASGAYSTAMGWDSTASGINSFSWGRNSVSNSEGSVVLGVDSNATFAYATAIGRGATASGYGALAIGNATIARSGYEVVLGRANTDYTPVSEAGWADGDRLFVIGNGRLNQPRSNAVTILKNGNIGIGTDTPQELLHLSGGRLRIGDEVIEDGGNDVLAFSSSLVPLVDGDDRLGGPNRRWQDVYAANGMIQTSDRRSKTNIVNLDYGLAEVLQMQPVSFNWRNKNNPDTKLGLIAQDLQALIPEVVHSHIWEKNEVTEILAKKELDRLGVYYSDLVPVLIKAIQEQQEIITIYKKEVSELSQEVQEIKKNLKILRDVSNQ